MKRGLCYIAPGNLYFAIAVVSCKVDSCSANYYRTFSWLFIQLPELYKIVLPEKVLLQKKAGKCCAQEENELSECRFSGL